MYCQLDTIVIIIDIPYNIINYNYFDVSINLPGRDVQQVQ